MKPYYDLGRWGNLQIGLWFGQFGSKCDCNCKYDFISPNTKLYVGTCYDLKLCFEWIIFSHIFLSLTPQIISHNFISVVHLLHRSRRFEQVWVGSKRNERQRRAHLQQNPFGASTEVSIHILETFFCPFYALHFNMC